MESMTTEREDSAKLALRFLAREGIRERLAESGSPSDSPVVVCEWDTDMVEVRAMVSRVRARKGDEAMSVLILVRRDDQILPLVVGRLAAPFEDVIFDHDIHGASAIGHVYQALEPKTWDVERGISPEARLVTSGGLRFTLV